MKIDFKKIEKEAQIIWKDQNVFHASDSSDKPKYYALDMFPYPSGDGLHVGHIKGYFATDIISHYKRLKGFNVIHPMGWDAFGLPAENYAIKVKKNPRDVVKQNIENFKKQMNKLGLSYDWSREINTTDPNYFKWTQWIFLQMFKKGLAYQDKVPINFCPSCKTGLANEEVVSGKCERCGNVVIKKEIRQWVLRITEYADRLLQDLEELDWPEPIKLMQRNWIGRSEGTNILFQIEKIGKDVKVFTTRADTLFGCTYIVLSPEHELTKSLIDKASNPDKIRKYVEKSKNKSDLERTDLAKTKTGVKVDGIKAINPINGEQVQVWIADYVLASYGTGAVMAVPAHDQRDYDFAKKYGIEIKKVIDASNIDISNSAYEGEGALVNSQDFNGKSSQQAREDITKELSKNNQGELGVNYKLRDWVFSRQRYWGEPIPLVHCDKCGIVPVKEEDLPVTLPDVESYEPTGTGESPLAKIESWVNTKCPKCDGPGKRETNTMPQWAGSCWYYLRYLDPNNQDMLCNRNLEEYYMPVDLYVGGAEHAVLHLLYARFWHKFLYDIEAVSTKEPFSKLRNVGLIIAPDGQKMSKSRGNVIRPDDLIDKHGADALRLYEMFIGPFEKSASWAKNGIIGTEKLINSILDSFDNNNFSDKENKSINAKISSLSNNVESKIENLQFNTIVSDFMKFSNDVDLKMMTKNNWIDFIILLSPFAPHVSEYLWSKMGNNKSVFFQKWPELNVKDVNSNINYVVQVNGKKRAQLKIQSEEEKEEIIEKAKMVENVQKEIDKDDIIKVIFVKNKIINFVTKKG